MKIPLYDTLSALLLQVNSSESARFFRGELDVTTLPGYATVITNPIHLGDIQRKIHLRLYSSVSELANDVTLLVNNAKLYNGPQHPVAKAAEELFAFFIETLSSNADQQLAAASPPGLPEPSAYFPCPTCHIAICTTCKQVEHRPTPCDTSARDSEELAILEQFGYKRCPRCRHGLRRMYGEYSGHSRRHAGATADSVIARLLAHAVRLRSPLLLVVHEKPREMPRRLRCR